MNTKKLTISISLFTILAIIVLGVIFFIPEEKTIKIDLLIAEKNNIALAKDSVGIVTGVVENILPSQKSVNKYTGDTILFTDIILSVDKKLKGDNIEKKVTLRIPGGTIGEGKEKLTVVVEDVPEFIIGEKILVFLSKGNDGFFDLPDGYYTIEGWFQGKYQIINGELKNPKGIFSLDKVMNEINSAL